MGLLPAQPCDEGLAGTSRNQLAHQKGHRFSALSEEKVNSLTKGK